MATKTISVDLEAYERLRRAKSNKRESFSKVIKRAVWEPSAGTAGHLLKSVRSAAADETLSKAVLDKLDQLQELDAPSRNPWTGKAS